MEIKVFDQIEATLKQEFGNLWDENKESLQDWAKVITKLQLDAIAGRGSCNKLAMQYAEAGLSCLKSRLQFRLESATWNVIEKSLVLLLRTTIALVENSGTKIG